MVLSSPRQPSSLITTITQNLPKTQNQSFKQRTTDFAQHPLSVHHRPCNPTPLFQEIIQSAAALCNERLESSASTLINQVVQPVSGPRLVVQLVRPNS